MVLVILNPSSAIYALMLQGPSCYGLDQLVMWSIGKICQGSSQATFDLPWLG